MLSYFILFINVIFFIYIHFILFYLLYFKVDLNCSIPDKGYIYLFIYLFIFLFFYLLVNYK